jgi:hypothetical protein
MHTKNAIQFGIFLGIFSNFGNKNAFFKAPSNAYLNAFSHFFFLATSAGVSAAAAGLPFPAGSLGVLFG